MVNPRTASMLDGDLKALAVKFKAVPGNSKEMTLVVNLLLTAQHLMKPLLAPQVAAPRSSRYVPEPSDDEPDADEDDEEDPAPVRTKRNLRQEWGGDLPVAIARKQPDTIVDPKTGILGISPDNFNVTKGHPNTLCPQCKIPIGSTAHATDHNSPVDTEGFRPKIACDGTRVYCGRTE